MKVEIRELPTKASVSDEPETVEYETEKYEKTRYVFEEEIAEQIPNLVEWSREHKDDFKLENNEYSNFQREVMRLTFMDRYWIMKALHEGNVEKFFHECGDNDLWFQHAETIYQSYTENNE